ncbi:hypothetical protein [Desulfogranum japonicum]|uniref:hypothetical protein n=1 Tax=Desulfogranum japonicum TaxID=231447 RepID=UPI00048FAB32|nr:hypothetical protein [Desulfogranum japonicum]
MRKTLPIVTIVLISFFLFRYNSLDGIDGLIFSTFFIEDTVYSEGYSEKKYKSIDLGMSKEKVLKILGKPLYTNEKWEAKKSEDRWWYTKSPGDTHYRIREIRFSNNQVTEKHHEYYVD